MPSRMKIHRHPARPAMPSMFTIAAASNPENADARDAAEKKTAIRVCTSKRQYQVVNRNVAAGKKPDSNSPRSTLVTIRCSSKSGDISFGLRRVSHHSSYGERTSLNNALQRHHLIVNRSAMILTRSHADRYSRCPMLPSRSKSRC
jgi:hypothetical protein